MRSVHFLLSGDDGTLERLLPLVACVSTRRPGCVSHVLPEDSWEERAQHLVQECDSRAVICLLDGRSIHLTPGVLERLCLVFAGEEELGLPLATTGDGPPLPVAETQSRVLLTAPLDEFPELRVEVRMVRGDAPSDLRRAVAFAPRSVPAHRREFTRQERTDLLACWFEGGRFFPSTIFIEVTTACNLRCPMCPCHGEGRAQDIPGAFMDVEVYTRIVDEAVRHDVPRGRVSINPQLRGESTLHPRFPEMLRLAHERGLRVTLSTNAVLFRPDVVEAVARWSDYVFISLDAARPDTYRRIRGADHAQVLAGVEELLALRRRLRGDAPHVYAAFVCLDENRGELDEFLEYWRSRADGVLVYQERVAPGWYREGDDLPGPPRERIPCSHVVGSCSIMVDGTLAPCCFSTSALEPLGRLTPTTTLEELYNAPDYRRFRAMHAAHRFADSPLCADCNAWGIYRPAADQPPGWVLLRNSYSRFYLTT